MLQTILSKVATTTIFWAPDFSNWRSAVDNMYPTSIESITNFRVFKTYSLNPNSYNIFDY